MNSYRALTQKLLIACAISALSGCATWDWEAASAYMASPEYQAHQSQIRQQAYYAQQQRQQQYYQDSIATQQRNYADQLAQQQMRQNHALQNQLMRMQNSVNALAPNPVYRYTPANNYGFR